MKRILSLAIVALMLSPAAALADTYFFGQFGYVMIEDLMDETDGAGVRWEAEAEDGWAAGIGFGRNYELFRFDLEMVYQRNSMDEVKVTYPVMGSATESVSGQIRSLTTLANFYYDLSNATPITPYITGGIGFSYVRNTTINIVMTNERIRRNSDTVFAGQLGVGIGYELRDDIFIDLKYRYFRTEDPDLGGFEFDYENHIVFLGMRVPFS